MAGGYEAAAWLGYAAPAGTPVEIRRRLASEIDHLLLLPKVRDRIKLDRHCGTSNRRTKVSIRGLRLCTCGKTRSPPAALRTMREQAAGLSAKMRMKAAQPVGTRGLCWM
jgi:hypothetical protein